MTAARTLLGDAVRVTGASRTDAGVHALRQVVSLRAETSLDAATIGRALNASLPPDLRVRMIADAVPGFDARRHAHGKRYAYLLDVGGVADPLLRRYCWHVRHALDVDAMRLALAAVVGAHDFSAFCAAPGRDAMPVCRVRAVHVRQRKSRVAILVSADRFLHHMVRNLVGSAVAVGRGSKEPPWLADVLKSRDRRLAGPTAPAHGLTLVRVLYGPRTV